MVMAKTFIIWNALADLSGAGIAHTLRQESHGRHTVVTQMGLMMQKRQIFVVEERRDVRIHSF